MEEELLLDKEKLEKAKKQYNALPYWHKKNFALVINTLISVREYAPQLEQIAQILIPRFPRMVRASQNLKSINIEHSSHLFSLHNAIDLPWISFDSKGARNVLLFDIDHDRGPELAAELPENIRPHIVVDPWSGRSAGILVLKSPVLTGSGSKMGPQLLANGCHEMMAKYFEATALPHGSLTKNPFGTLKNIVGVLGRRTPEPSSGILWEAFQEANSGLCWHVIPGAAEIELRDILKHFEDDYEQIASDRSKKNFIKKKDRGEPSYIGRNCYVFDLVRFYCYDENETDEGNIYMKAEEINCTMSNPLPNSDIKAISRSIHKFMTTRYRPTRRINKGIMDLERTDLDIKQKQKLAALRSSDIKADDTQHKIRQAIRLFPEGKKLTQKAVSDMSGVCLRTVKKHWKNVT